MNTITSRHNSSGSSSSLLILFIGKNGKSFCERLIDYNYVGLSFASMQKALSWLNAQKQDVNVPFAIIADLQLPDGNAFDLCKHTQADPVLKDIFFVVVARNFVPASEERARELGIDAYFPYPPLGRVMHQTLRLLHEEKILNAPGVSDKTEGGFLTMLRKLVTPGQ